MVGVVVVVAVVVAVGVAVVVAVGVAVVVAVGVVVVVAVGVAVGVAVVVAVVVMKAIETEAIFTRFATRVDGSLSATLCTPELAVNEKVALMELQNKNVIVLIQPKDEIPSEVMRVSKILDFKTPSQRLRGIIFLEWKAQKPDCTFDTFYTTEIDRIIEHKKQRLNLE